MISVTQAERLILQQVIPTPTVVLPLTEATGEVLREPIRADRPLPPFDRVTMDGIALAYRDWRDGCREFHVEGVQRAGDPPRRRRQPGGCIEIMTGAALPAGCDCIVPVEYLRATATGVRVDLQLRLQPRQYIHGVGTDAPRDSELLAPGLVLDGPAVAVAASVGKHRLRVAGRPAVAIISTGDELVDIDQRPAAHQIRRSNPYALAASLRARGYHRLTLAHAPDDVRRQRRVLADGLAAADVVLLTGGVSKGRADFVPAILQALRVRQVFHRVRQRPGRPLWFGHGRRHQLVFGLPGNPASCLVCLHRYVLPALDRARGVIPAPVQVRLAAPVRRGPLTWLQAVQVRDGRATMVPLNTSGDFLDLARSDGFVELAAGTGHFRGGSAVRFWPWK